MLSKNLESESGRGGSNILYLIYYAIGIVCRINIYVRSLVNIYLRTFNYIIQNAATDYRYCCKRCNYACNSYYHSFFLHRVSVCVYNVRR